MEFSAAAELAELRAQYARIDPMLERRAEDLSRVVHAISGWSAEHHIAHLSLANELVNRNLRSLLKGSGPFVVDSGEPVPAAMEYLVAGVFPRGRAQAPRIVRPPAVVEREYLLEWLAGNRREFAEMEPRAGELATATKRVPHQLIGPLSAVQWLRFAAAHTRHHLNIADEVLSAPR